MTCITSSNNCSIYVRDIGEGNPVILIHGWPLSSETWEFYAMKLADAGLRVISYDRRGFGRSDLSWKGYDYSSLADDLACIIREKNLNNVTLVGFSMGGGEVVRYISHYKAKNISKVVLISSVIPYLLKTETNCDGVDSEVFDNIKNHLEKDRAHFYAGFFKDFYGVGVLSKPVSEEVLEWTRRQAMQAGLKATLDCVDSFSKTDFRKEILSLQSIPTLIIHGTGDKIVPIEPTARQAHKLLPHSELIEIEGAPHGLLVTHQDDVLGELIRFI